MSRYFTTFLSILLLFSIGYTQNSDSIKAKMNRMAVQNNYGIILTTIDKNFVTTQCTDFVGLYEIIPDSKKLDTVLTSPLMKGENAKASLMKLAQMMSSKGVKLRKSGNYEQAFYSYRLPFYLICNAMDSIGGRILSSNLWVLKEEIKHEVKRDDLIKINNLLKSDAEFLLKRYGSKLLQLTGSKQAGLSDYCQLKRRLHDFAGDMKASENLVLAMQKNFNAKDILENEVFVTALIEHLAQVSSINIIDPKENNAFQTLWNIYTERGKLISNDNVSFYRTELYWLWKNLDLVRMEMVNIGGPLGHQLSYKVSEYMQIPGREIIFYDFILKQPLNALAMSESVKARAFNDWMTRSHPSGLLKIKTLTASSKPLKITEYASEYDIYDAADSMRSPILSYMACNNYWFSWLILPGGKVFYNYTKVSDSLFKRLFDQFPYQFQTEIDGSKTAELGKRGFGFIGADQQNVQPILKKFWHILLSDSMEHYITSPRYEKLIIIADGVLNYFPFAALTNDQGKFLAEYKQLVYWPSVTSWLILKDAEQVSDIYSSELPVLIAGDVNFKGKYITEINNKMIEVKLTPLPGTATEVQKIAELYGTSPVIKDNVNLQIFEGRKKRDILHLATHGYLNSDKSGRSFIAMSDGPLYADDLYNEMYLLRSDLVVLSACQTGLGDFGKDSPLSLANSFLLGGANSVISSLWSVDDEATSEFMIAFYTRLKEGYDAAQSLFYAQSKIRSIAKWRNPYFWAGFKLTGLSSNPMKK